MLRARLDAYSKAKTDLFACPGLSDNIDDVEDLREYFWNGSTTDPRWCWREKEWDYGVDQVFQVVRGDGLVFLYVYENGTTFWIVFQQSKARNDEAMMITPLLENILKAQSAFFDALDGPAGEVKDLRTAVWNGDTKYPMWVWDETKMDWKYSVDHASACIGREGLVFLYVCHHTGESSWLVFSEDKAEEHENF